MIYDLANGPRLSGRCGFGEGTFAGTRGNGKEAAATATPAPTDTHTASISYFAYVQLERWPI
jgi:hypothetical protein